MSRFPASLYHARRRTRSLRDPTSALFRTHTLPTSGTFDVGDRFPDRSRVITVRMDIHIGASTGDTAVIFFGSSPGSGGLFLGLISGSLFVGCGAGADDSDHNVSENVTSFAMANTTYSLVLSAIPGTGEVRVWSNGTLVVRARAPFGTFDGDWAPDETGNVIATGDATIARVEAYDGQVPRHFDSAA